MGINTQSVEDALSTPKAANRLQVEALTSPIV